MYFSHQEVLLRRIYSDFKPNAALRAQRRSLGIWRPGTKYKIGAHFLCIIKFLKAMEWQFKFKIVITWNTG